jgi:adenine-specific DNA-methyltransferase
MTSLKQNLTMDYSKKTRNDLIKLCKVHNIKCYSNKKKDELIELIKSNSKEDCKDEIIPQKRIRPKVGIHNTTHKKDTGQYFTISNDLQLFIFNKVKYKSYHLLEPSFGAGHLLKKFKEYDENYPITCYELDNTITPIITFNSFQRPIYSDFTQQIIIDKFKTIIGNPPYVKKSTGNLYIEFIELCYNYLDHDGELIFIVPSDFIKSTRASSIIHKMTTNGSFTDFLFPHDEKLFEGASIDILIFRYEKGLKTNITSVNGKDVYCNVNNGIITFSDNKIIGNPITDLFNVYVGLVSGRDEIYRVPFGNIDILNDKDRIEKFIFTEIFPTNHIEIDNHLLEYKSDLLERKIKKFSEKNWFEWGAPRNISSIKTHWNQPCIYVRNITRNKEVAFIGNVQYFGGSLLCLIPKNNIIISELEKIVKYLNSEVFQKDYIYAGRFKIGHKQISNAIIPN